jgi:hypothetical protein
LSLAQLTRGRGWNSELSGFLAPFARQDFVYVEDDFTEDTLNATRWEVATDAGSTAFAWNTAASGGVITGVTEAASGDYVAVNGELTWLSNKNCGTEICLKQDVIITHLIEYGFTDALSDETLPAINDIDTPSTTNGSTDISVIARDTSQTLTTLALVADGTTGAAAKTNFDTACVPAASTYYKMLVQCATNQSFGVFNNQYHLGVTVLQGPDTATLVRPHFILGTLASTAITVDIDYIRVWQER